MIKLKEVNVVHGVTSLVFEYDLEGQTYTVEVNELVLYQRYNDVKRLLNHNLSLQDIKQIVVGYVNEVRDEKIFVDKKVDYDQFIGMDLEG